MASQKQLQALLLHQVSDLNTLKSIFSQILGEYWTYRLGEKSITPEESFNLAYRSPVESSWNSVKVSHLMSSIKVAAHRQNQTTGEGEAKILRRYVNQLYKKLLALYNSSTRECEECGTVLTNQEWPKGTLCPICYPMGHLDI